MSAARSVPARIAGSCARLLGERRRVLVALSGGLDSVALLHALRFQRSDLSIAAAHFDHAMRAGSAADAQWVRGLCTAWDIQLHSAAAEDPPASEAAAREMRYAFLHAAADACGAEAILTAHHADDQAETVLFRLARGTGLAGLRGIAERRGVIVRPMLDLTRAEIVAYARAMRLRWRDDPTNRSLRFARNRIRHRVLPELERAAPGAARRIAGIASAATAAERAWMRLVGPVLEDVVTGGPEGGFVLARERLLAYDPHLRARVIRHLLERLGNRPDRAATRRALAFAAGAGSGRSIALAGGISIAREFDALHVRPSADTAGRDADRSLHIDSAEPGAGTFVAGGRRYLASWTNARTSGATQSARFDPSSLRFPLELRAWRPGDRIRLGYGSKKLKKLLQERRVGRQQRVSVPVLVDAEGGILWVPGVARAAAAQPEPGAEALEIMVTDGDTQ